MKFALFFRFFDSWYKYLLTEAFGMQLMFCGPSTADVCNIDSLGSTKQYCFPQSQSISVRNYCMHLSPVITLLIKHITSNLQ